MTDFCSRASIAAGEPFAGTGVRAEAYLFLPVEKRHWRDKEMNREWAHADELQMIRELRPHGVVTRLYNPPDDASGQPARLLLHAPQGDRSPALEEALAVFGRRWPIDASGDHRLAICTHGTRDRCCAKWGFAAYQAARALHQAGRSPFAPIECSHLGGDRFAATGIFFPSGSMYAHLDATNLPTLCTLEAEGRLDPAWYRGRVFDPPLVQLARAGLAASGHLNDAHGRLEVRTESPEVVDARFGERRFRLTLASEEVVFFGSCAHLESRRKSRGRRTTIKAVHALGEAPLDARRLEEPADREFGGDGADEGE